MSEVIKSFFTSKMRINALYSLLMISMLRHSTRLLVSMLASKMEIWSFKKQSSQRTRLLRRQIKRLMMPETTERMFLSLQRRLID